VPIVRGISRQPLFVTTIGTDVAAAAAAVLGMHGAHRIPTLLKRVDRLARDA
jgi:deoxyribonuclease V